MTDDGLVDRLYAAGAKFGSDIIPETSPMAAFLLNWVLPIAIFGGLGYYFNETDINPPAELGRLP
jgi:cell division protease FtsH